MEMLETKFGRTVRIALLGAATALIGIPAAQAGGDLYAPTVDHEMVLDGNVDDWTDVPGTTVPLRGDGGVASVDIKWAIRGGRIYMLAVWADSTENILHKPYKWNEADKAYAKTKDKEDRFAVSLRMSGDFSHNKLSGAEFVADVWHWKASRSNPAGLAHDKWWKVSSRPFKKGEEFETPDGKKIYMGRMSDKGDKLYKSRKFDTKQEDIMSRYVVNMSAQGSIADVQAKGVWRDGYWYLEMARDLDTGNSDDAVIPASGQIAIALGICGESGDHLLADSAPEDALGRDADVSGSRGVTRGPQARR